MVMNFNEAEQDGYGDKKKLELIPDKTIGAMKIHLIDPREGDKPERIVEGQPYLNLSQRDGKTQYLVLNIELLNGDMQGRRFFQNLTVYTPNPDNPAKNITMKLLRSIIESALGINPNDDSPEAAAKRDMSAHKDWGFLHGLQFVGAVKIQAGKAKNDGSGDKWPDSNQISYALTAKNGDEYYRHAAVYGLTNAAPAAPIGTPAFSPDTDKAPAAPAAAAPASTPNPEVLQTERPDWLNQ